jgi:hypothetical protein
MTQPTLSLTESNTLQALGQFLVAVLPTGTAVVVGQDNRVASPQSANYAVMTPIMRTRLATNLTTYADGFPSNPTTRSDTQATMVTIQVDTFGPASGDNAQIIQTLFRSDWSCEQFAGYGFDVTPLYTSDPRQMKFTDESAQVQQRWSIDLQLQASPVVTVPQDFADELVVGVVNVDASYPPA